MNILTMPHILIALIIIFLAGLNTGEIKTRLEEIYLTYYPAQDNNEQVISDLFQHVDEHLESHGYVLNVIKLQKGQTDPRQLISFSVGYQYLLMSINKSPLAEVSPILVEPNISFSWLSTEVTANMLTGLLLYTTGHCGDAMPYWKYVIDNHMSYIDREPVPILRGNCAAIQGDYREAIRHYESLYSEYWIESSQPEYYLNLAWLYLQESDEAKAFELADFAVKLSSFYEAKQSFFLSKRAQLYTVVDNHDAALDDLNTAISIEAVIINQQQGTPRYNPSGERNLAYYYTLRGQMYLNLYEWDNSLADFNTALELDPEYAEAYFQRGVLYYSILQTGQELREEALADFWHYRELAPDGPYAEQAADYAQTIEAELAAFNE